VVIPGFPNSGTVIILDISEADYSPSELEVCWPTQLGQTHCPACGQVGRYSRHSLYRKYHYQQQITILRVRCRGCRHTHAIMPSFSLPGTSIGTGEAEQYLLARARAGTALLEQGLHAGYPKLLERRFLVAISRAKALWPQAADERLSGLAWVCAVCGPTDRPLLALNRYALDHQVNAVCFCRVSILLFGRTAKTGCFSHTLDSAGNSPAQVDSG